MSWLDKIEWLPPGELLDDPDALVVIKGGLTDCEGKPTGNVYYAVCKYTEKDRYGESGYVEVGQELYGCLGRKGIKGWIPLPE